MKKRFILTFTILLFILAAQGQETKKKKNYFSVFIESPLFYKDWYEDPGNVGYLNFEILQRRKENFANSYSFGLLLIAHIEGLVYVPEQPNLYFQYGAVFGKKRHFFELGAGLGVPAFLLNFRIGYRMELGKRFLFQAGF